jgi:hypothetical protein
MGQACWGENHRENEVINKRGKDGDHKGRGAPRDNRPRKRTVRVSEDNRGAKYRPSADSELSSHQAEFTDRGLSFFDEEDSMEEEGENSEESDQEYLVCYNSNLFGFD